MTLLSTLFRRSEKRHALSSLMSLDDRMLADIGLTRSDVYQMMGPTRGRTTSGRVPHFVGRCARAPQKDPISITCAPSPVGVISSSRRGAW